MAAALQPAPSDFDEELASLPNEVFSLIFEKLHVLDIISVLTHVGLELFTKYISFKRILPRICSLEFENIIWNKDKFEESLFIYWAIFLPKHKSSTKLLRNITSTSSDQQKDMTASWNFSDSDNKMNIGNKISRCPIKTIREFLNAKREWFHYEIVICEADHDSDSDIEDSFDSEDFDTDEDSGNGAKKSDTVEDTIQKPSSFYFDTSNWNKNNYYICLIEFCSPRMLSFKTPITPEIIYIINNLVSRKKFELVLNQKPTDKNYFKLILQPIVKLDFNFEPFSTLYQQIFPSLPTPYLKQWFTTSISYAEFLWDEIETLEKNNNLICGHKIFQIYKLRFQYLGRSLSLVENDSFRNGLRSVFMLYLSKPSSMVAGYIKRDLSCCSLSPLMSATNSIIDWIILTMVSRLAETPNTDNK